MAAVKKAWKRGHLRLRAKKAEVKAEKARIKAKAATSLKAQKALEKAKDREARHQEKLLEAYRVKTLAAANWNAARVETPFEGPRPTIYQGGTSWPWQTQVGHGRG